LNLLLGFALPSLVANSTDLTISKFRKLKEIGLLRFARNGEFSGLRRAFGTRNDESITRKAKEQEALNQGLGE
jgi:hypothetical protein